MDVRLSKLFGLQQGVNEVDHEPYDHEARERIVEDHESLPQSRSHAYA
jgi:hypothetical protein